MTLEIYESALDWLGKGFHLLPIQPGTKKQARGFGVHQKRITNMQQAALWFNNPSKFNLAVIAPEDKFIIDFDDWQIYIDWVRVVKKFCAVTTSRTEITPRGGTHVFTSGQIPPTFKPIQRVEIKKVVLVAPSTLDNASLPYEVMIDGEILSASLAALSPLSQTPICAPVALRQVARVALPNDGTSKLDRIKSRFSIFDLMRKHYPKVALRGRGRYITACCPFHAEKEPSFWIDTEKNLFGCHACKARGDVINFFALANGIDNQEAIKQMSGEK